MSCHRDGVVIETQHLEVPLPCGVVAYSEGATEPARSLQPYDAVASLAMMIVPVVVVLTWVRSVRWRREATYPSFARVEIARGCVVVLLAIAATDAAYVVAVLVRGFSADASLRAGLLGLLGLSIITLAVAFGMWATAWWWHRGSLNGRGDVVLSGRPDAVDDVAGLLRSAPASIAPLRRVSGRIADLLSSWAETSGASPRRHPWLFVATVSCAVGVGAAASEFVHEGLPPSVWVGALVVAVFGSVVAVAGLLGYAIMGRYLHLVRPSRHA